MRVLLIEDDSATAQSIELMLQSEGFNVYKTDLGEEGVDQILALLGVQALDTNVNLPNRGQLPDLPLGAIVETNAQFRKGRLARPGEHQREGETDAAGTDHGDRALSGRRPLNFQPSVPISREYHDFGAAMAPSFSVRMASVPNRSPIWAAASR